MGPVGRDPARTSHADEGGVQGLGRSKGARRTRRQATRGRNVEPGARQPRKGAAEGQGTICPVSPPRTADELRAAFLDFFAQRGHTPVPSSSLIPHDDTLLFTNAGMVPFKPYFVGDETPPYPRATSIQKCVRAGRQAQRPRGRRPHQPPLHVLRDARQLQLRRLLQAEAIEWAWELYTEVLGLDPERLWVTVHTTDDEAEEIWRDDGRAARRADPAPRRRQLLAHGRHRPLRPELGDLLGPRPRVRSRHRAGGERGPLRRDLEPRVHAVRRQARRRAGAAAGAERRHRCRARTQPRRAPGRRVRRGTSTCSVR